MGPRSISNIKIVKIKTDTNCRNLLSVTKRLGRSVDQVSPKGFLNVTFNQLRICFAEFFTFENVAGICYSTGNLYANMYVGLVLKH